MIARPHDLIWVSQVSALKLASHRPEWVDRYWQTSLPLVVRRDRIINHSIPVGIRGMKRSQRQAATVNQSDIIKVISPEQLVVDVDILINNSFSALPAIRALIVLKSYHFPWSWGVTGSCGYQLATGIEVMTEQSDLDLLIRCPNPTPLTNFSGLTELLATLDCRVDVQIETPYGGFALIEWLRGGQVMLKTSQGPLITDNPWQLERV